jgi:hypothetical protein
VQFVVLLDDDKAGREAKARYRKELFLNEHEVLTIEDLLPADAGNSFDQLIEDDARALIRSKVGGSSSGKLDKREIALFFLGYASEASPVALPDTVAKFRTLFESLAQLFKL